MKTFSIALGLIVLWFSVFLSSKPAYALKLSRCENPQKISRLLLQNAELSEHVQTILNQFKPHIEEGVNKAILPDVELIRSENCPDNSNLWGVHKGCLYAPQTYRKDTAFGIRLKSQPIKVQMYNMGLSGMKIEKIKSKCKRLNGYFRCEVLAEVPNLTFESQLRVSKFASDDRIIGTLSPARVEFFKRPGLVSIIKVPFLIRMGDVSRESVEVVSDEVELLIPESTFAEHYPNSIVDINEALEFEIQRARQQGKVNKDNYDQYVNKLADYLEFNFKHNSYLTLYLEKINIIHGKKQTIIDAVKGVVGKVIANTVAKNLPFSFSQKMTLPLKPSEDLWGGCKRLSALQSMADKMQQLTELIIKTESERDLTKYYRQTRAMVSGLDKTLQAIELSHEKRFIQILPQIKGKLQELVSAVINRNDFIKGTKSFRNKRARSDYLQIIDFYQEMDDKFDRAKEQIQANINTKSIRLNIKMQSLKPMGKESFLADLAICDEQNEFQVSDSWYQMNRFEDLEQGTDFKLQLDIGFLNSILKKMHEYGYFRICISENGKPCEMAGKSSRTYLTFKSSPQVIFNKESQKYVFMLGKIKSERSSGTFNYKDIPLIGKWVSEDHVNMYIDFNKIYPGPGQTITANDIYADVSLKENFKIDGRSFDIVGAVLAPMVGGPLVLFRLFRPLIVKKVLDDKMDNLADQIDNALDNFELFRFDRMLAKNDVISVYGHYLDKDDLRRQESSVIENSYSCE